jgi:hypothetical protein
MCSLGEVDLFLKKRKMIKYTIMAVRKKVNYYKQAPQLTLMS